MNRDGTSSDGRIFPNKERPCMPGSTTTQDHSGTRGNAPVRFAFRKRKSVGVPRDSAPHRENCTAVFPIRDSGLEMNWGLTAPALRVISKQGYVRVPAAQVAVDRFD